MAETSSSSSSAPFAVKAAAAAIGLFATLIGGRESSTLAGALPNWPAHSHNLKNSDALLAPVMFNYTSKLQMLISQKFVTKI